jgi:hypothetical protein
MELGTFTFRGRETPYEAGWIGDDIFLFVCGEKKRAKQFGVQRTFSYSIVMSYHKQDDVWTSLIAWDEGMAKVLFPGYNEHLTTEEKAWLKAFAASLM